jgi:hypothetical protein
MITRTARVFVPRRTDDLHPEAAKWVGQKVTVRSAPTLPGQLLVEEFGMFVPEDELAEAV